MFKYFKDDDFVSTISPIQETVTISRRYFSGGVPGANGHFTSPNLWTSSSFSGGLYVAAHDRNASEYPRTKLYSLSYGYTSSSIMYSGSGFFGTNREEKLRIYQMFAQNLLGDKNSRFIINGRESDEAIFVCINRNIFKDRILPHGLNLTTQLSGVWDSTDESHLNRAVPNFNIRKSFGGDYIGLNSASAAGVSRNEEVALCFLDKGVFVLDPYLSIQTGSGGGNNWSGSLSYEEIAKGLSGSVLDDMLFAARHRINSITFINESKMRTSFYRCDAETEEFNYSSNPSYLNDEGRILVTSGSANNLDPRTYITTIALVNKNHEVLAIGKLSKPIKKDPKTKVSIMTRLNY